LGRFFIACFWHIWFIYVSKKLESDWEMKEFGKVEKKEENSENG